MHTPRNQRKGTPVVLRFLRTVFTLIVGVAIGIAVRPHIEPHALLALSESGNVTCSPLRDAHDMMLCGGDLIEGDEAIPVIQEFSEMAHENGATITCFFWKSHLRWILGTTHSCRVSFKNE